MAFKCLECGQIFEDGEQAIWEETHGLDTPPYEKFSGCPICKGSYEETEQCKICGGEFLEDELNGSCVCDKCIEEYSRDFEICYKIGETEKEEIKINSLITSILNADVIEEILYLYLKNEKNVDCSAFVEDNKSWFADKLLEEVSK